MFSPTKPRTVSVFFAGVITVGGGNERTSRWAFTFSVWLYSWFSQCIRMTSNKVCDDSQRRRGDAAIQNDQQKSGKLLPLVITARRANSVLSFAFHYENDMRPWMFEQRRVWRIAIFSLDLFIIRHTSRHAEGLHLLFFWSYPIYKSFSLWN